MKPSLLVFAPKGDTDILLRKPNYRSYQETLPQAADPDVDAQENDEGAEQDDQNEPQPPVVEMLDDGTSSIESLDDLKNLKPFNEDGQIVELSYRVSSAHLMLVSPVFKAMLDGPFRESSRNEDGRFEVKTSEDVPKTIELGLLTDIAILVDYYEYHEIVEMFAENWIASIIPEDEIERSNHRTNMARLFISWVFGKSELFDSVVKDLLKVTAGPIKTDLPLPSVILDSIEDHRQALTQSFLDNLYALLNSFWLNDRGCHTECTAIMLGMLIKQMLRFGLEVPRATGRPAVEKSFSQLRDFSSNLKSPVWIARDDKYDHECTFEDITGPWLVEIDKVDVCSGVRFETFRRGFMKDSKSEGRLTKKERKKRKRDRHLP
ncbi:hypothetical protein FCIRC_3858 [Fusarium circinatum]|uniref:BTB domain-containing protein n=1 Tax=Fusarium circinatum TaxID=48490 RepID=A0A8H5X6R8_FUSCI|nr:hypothetical protein FCIRC_3858 [Fusarium circinatum]